MTRTYVIFTLIASATAFPFNEESSNEYDLFSEESHNTDDFSLEPATTYSKPILPLEFLEKAKRKPRGKNLNARRLLKKIGEDYNPTLMSVDRPASGLLNTKVSLPDTQVAELMEQVTHLDIETDIRQLLVGDDHKHEPTVSRAVGAFQQWLVKKSSCPVVFQWTDLGEYFWPRYVRQGECEGTGVGDTTSCSWPRGMNCAPADSQVLQLLRWHCSRRKSPDLLGLTVRQKIKKSYRCRWIKIPYPITSSCRCE